MSDVAAVIAAAIATGGTITAAWIAHRAEKNTRPISNGFADDVKRRLTRIEGLMVGHLEDHTQHDLMRRRRSSD